MNRRNDQGFTFSEVLVTMALFGIVGTVVTTAAISGLHHQRQMQNRSTALAQARTALERIDRDIRSADPLLSATASELVLQQTPATTSGTITYAICGSNLVVSEADPATVCAAPTMSRVLITNLVGAASPLFAVTPKTGYVAPTGGGVDPSTCVMIGGAFDPGCVGTITVHITFQPPALTSAISVSDNGTELRNAS